MGILQEKQSLNSKSKNNSLNSVSSSSLKSTSNLQGKAFNQNSTSSNILIYNAEGFNANDYINNSDYVKEYWEDGKTIKRIYKKGTFDKRRDWGKKKENGEWVLDWEKKDTKDYNLEQFDFNKNGRLQQRTIKDVYTKRYVKNSKADRYRIKDIYDKKIYKYDNTGYKTNYRKYKEKDGRVKLYKKEEFKYGTRTKKKSYDLNKNNTIKNNNSINYNEVAKIDAKLNNLLKGRKTSSLKGKELNNYNDLIRDSAKAQNRTIINNNQKNVINTNNEIIPNFLEANTMSIRDDRKITKIVPNFLESKTMSIKDDNWRDRVNSDINKVNKMYKDYEDNYYKEENKWENTILGTGDIKVKQHGGTGTYKTEVIEKDNKLIPNIIEYRKRKEDYKKIQEAEKDIYSKNFKIDYSDLEIIDNDLVLSNKIKKITAPAKIDIVKNLKKGKNLTIKVNEDKLKEIEKINKEIQNNTFELNKENVDRVRKVVKDSRLEALNNMKAVRHGTQVPLNVASETNRLILIEDNINKNLNKFYEEETAKAIGKYVVVTLLTAGVGEAIQIAKALPVVSKVWKGSRLARGVVKTAGYGLMGAYAGNTGYKTFKDIKAIKDGNSVKGMYGLADTSMEVTGFLSGAGLLKKYKGRMFRDLPRNTRSKFFETKMGQKYDKYRFEKWLKERTGNIYDKKAKSLIKGQSNTQQTLTGKGVSNERLRSTLDHLNRYKVSKDIEINSLKSEGENILNRMTGKVKQTSLTSGDHISVYDKIKKEWITGEAKKIYKAFGKEAGSRYVKWKTIPKNQVEIMNSYRNYNLRGKNLEYIKKGDSLLTHNRKLDNSKLVKFNKKVDDWFKLNSKGKYDKKLKWIEPSQKSTQQTLGNRHINDKNLQAKLDYLNRHKIANGIERNSIKEHNIEQFYNDRYGKEFQSKLTPPDKLNVYDSYKKKWIQVDNIKGFFKARGWDNGRFKHWETIPRNQLELSNKVRDSWTNIHVSDKATQTDLSKFGIEKIKFKQKGKFSIRNQKILDKITKHTQLKPPKPDVKPVRTTTLNGETINTNNNVNNVKSKGGIVSKTITQQQELSTREAQKLLNSLKYDPSEQTSYLIKENVPKIKNKVVQINGYEPKKIHYIVDKQLKGINKYNKVKTTALPLSKFRSEYDSKQIPKQIPSYKQENINKLDNKQVQTTKQALKLGQNTAQIQELGLKDTIGITTTYKDLWEDPIDIIDPLEPPIEPPVPIDPKFPFWWKNKTKYGKSKYSSKFNKFKHKQDPWKRITGNKKYSDSKMDFMRQVYGNMAL